MRRMGVRWGGDDSPERSTLNVYAHLRVHAFGQARSTRGHSVMLPAETFKTRKHLSNFSLEKPRQKVEEILKIYELFVYGNIQ